MVISRNNEGDVYMKAECNRCGEVSKMKAKAKRLKDKVKKHYFQCEHCNHVYVIGYTNEDIRREQKKIRRPIDKNAGNGLYENEIREKEKLIESKMNELKQRIEASA